MHAARKLAGKYLVHHAVALEAALSTERIRHDMDPEMGLSLGPVPGVPGVLMGLVDDI
jgi:hypothetical protein